MLCARKAFGPEGIRVLGFRGLGFRGLGFRGLGFRVLGFRVLGYQGFRIFRGFGDRGLRI